MKVRAAFRHGMGALALLALGFFGCAEGSGEGPNTGTGECSCGGAACGFDPCGNACGAGCGDAESCMLGQCVADATCDVNGFPVTSQAAYTRLVGGARRMQYVATTGNADPPFEKMVVELSHDRFFEDGAPRTGTFDLSTLDPNSCDLCIKAFSYCNSDDCFNHYIPVEGQVEISESGEPGTHFKGRLLGARFKEIRYDANGNVKDHPNGKTFCLGDYAFDAEVPEISSAADNCVADGSGKNIGDNIADFTLTNCLGEETNLHDRCGQAKAVWIVAVAGWCGACETFVPGQVAPTYDERADEGLDVMVVIGENQASGPPDLAYCKAYAQSHGMDPHQVFIDNDGQSWGETFGHINTYSTSIGLPWNAVLDGRSMEYKWASSASEGNLYDEIDKLLAAP